METIEIGLNKLVLWTGNVRKTSVQTGLDELVASISVHGLLQPLVVKTGKRGRYEIIAGQRRYLALSALAKAGKIEGNAPIPCRVAADGMDSAEIGLAENVVRVQMHPADQFDAFRALADKGTSPTEIAARFGVSENIIAKRLKLARVSPALLADYRAGEMSLEQVQAFTISDDYGQQERVWAETKGTWRARPDDLRRMLTDGEIPATDRRVRFVTLAAYEAAGGTVRRDLFDDETEGYIDDAALLDRLATETLEAEANRLRGDGWNWAECRLSSFQWEDTKHLRHVYPEDNDEEDDGDDYPAETKAIAGVLISIGYDGNLVVELGWIRPEDDTRDSSHLPSMTVATKATDVPKEQKGLSAALIEKLTARRTAALRAALSQRPDVALAATVYSLLVSLGIPQSRSASCIGLLLRPTSLERAIPDAEQDAALAVIERERKTLGSHVPGTGCDLWDWCLAKDTGQLVDILTTCVATSVNAVISKRGDLGATEEQRHHADRLAAALDLDMTAWWTPTAGNFFSRIGKADILAAIDEAKGCHAMAAEKMKKAELAVYAERQLEGTGWLPALMRRQATIPEAEECL